MSRLHGELSLERQTNLGVGVAACIQDHALMLGCISQLPCKDLEEVANITCCPHCPTTAVARRSYDITQYTEQPMGAPSRALTECILDIMPIIYIHKIPAHLSGTHLSTLATFSSNLSTGSAASRTSPLAAFNSLSAHDQIFPCN